MLDLCTLSDDACEGLISLFLQARPALAHELVDLADPEGPPDILHGRFEGVVKSYWSKKGYGFLECPHTFAAYGCDIYINRLAIGLFQKGDRVYFSVELNKEGKPQGKNLFPVTAEAKRRQLLAASQGPGFDLDGYLKKHELGPYAPGAEGAGGGAADGNDAVGPAGGDKAPGFSGRQKRRSPGIVNGDSSGFISSAARKKNHSPATGNPNRMPLGGGPAGKGAPAPPRTPEVPGTRPTVRAGSTPTLPPGSYGRPQGNCPPPPHLPAKGGPPHGGGYHAEYGPDKGGKGVGKWYGGHAEHVIGRPGPYEVAHYGAPPPGAKGMVTWDGTLLSPGTQGGKGGTQPVGPSPYEAVPPPYPVGPFYEPGPPVGVPQPASPGATALYKGAAPMKGAPPPGAPVTYIVKGPPPPFPGSVKGHPPPGKGLPPGMVPPPYA